MSKKDRPVGFSGCRVDSGIRAWNKMSDIDRRVFVAASVDHTFGREAYELLQLFLQAQERAEAQGDTLDCKFITKFRKKRKTPTP